MVIEMLDELLRNKNTYIFDLDGTLIDSMWVWNRADAFLLRDLAHVNIDELIVGKERDEFLAQVKSNNPYIEYVIYLKEKYNFIQDIEEIEAYRSYIAKELMKTITLKPYVKEVLSLLKEMKMTICLATTGSYSHVQNIIEKNENTNFLGNNIFATIVTQNDVINLKPSPDLHLLLQDRLGFKTEEAVIIEDSVVGIGAAISAGIDYITVKEEYNLEQERIKELSKYYINSLQILYKSLQKYNGNSPKIRHL